MRSGWLRLSAMILGVLAAGFWIWFGIASAATERLGLDGWLLHLLLPGGILTLSLLVALRWQRVGGVLLALEGGVAAMTYSWMIWNRVPRATLTFILLTLALPPFLAGIFLLVDSSRARTPHV